jgi:hypothetical protein
MDEGILQPLKEVVMVPCSPSCFFSSEEMVEHFMIDDIVNDILGDKVPVENGIDPDDPGMGRIASQPHGFWISPFAKTSPSDEAIDLILKIQGVDFLIKSQEIEKSTLLTKHYPSFFAFPPGFLDLILVLSDEGSKERVDPPGATGDEFCKGFHFLPAGLEK